MMNIRFLRATALAFFIAWAGCFVADGFVNAQENPYILTGYDADTVMASVKPLVPKKEHKQTLLDTLSILKYSHYNYQAVDDRLSEAVFERYLSALDTRKINFLSTDIRAFEPVRYAIDDALKAGDATFIFDIFNIYRERALKRTAYMLQQVRSDLEQLDFNKDESLEKDRKASPWPGDRHEQIQLWQKYVKYDVLNLILARKTPEEIRDTLEKRYRYQFNRLKQLDSEDGFSIFMNALSHCYDPHTSYLSPRNTRNFNIMMSLSLEGIGAVLQKEDEYTKVVRLIPSGPADKSKQISPGDLIVGVGQHENGEIIDVVGWRLDDVVELIRGPKKTVVRLELIPSDAIGESHREVINIVRDTVKLEEQAARSKVIDFKNNELPVRIGVIAIPSFYIDFDGYEAGKKKYKSTTRDVYRILKELAEERVDGILIDLRDNGGGALQEAISLTGLFIKEGPVVQVRDNQGRIKVYKDPDPAIRYKGPLVVLVNRLSASASEIFAGAIQDYNRGIITGSTTYGKGTVQGIETLPEGKLKLTRAIFYRASGASTQHKGILPDIFFPNIYDSNKIGESALDNAIAWDRIQSVRFSPAADSLSDEIRLLRSRHEKRVQDDPGFGYLKHAIRHLKNVRLKKTVTLNRSAREKEWKKAESIKQDLEEKRELAMKNAVQMRELSDWLADKTDLTEAEDEETMNDDRFDPILFESCNILYDLIKMENHADLM